MTKSTTHSIDFETLYDIYFDRVYRFVARRVHDTELTQDIVSESFLKIYKNLDAFIPQQEYSLISWIYTITHNEIRQHFRARKNKESISFDNVPELRSKEDVVDIVYKEQLHDTMKDLLEEIPLEEREIITYKYFDELQNIEIAELLKLSSNNVGVKLHRALQKFKTICEEHHITL